MCRLRSPLVSLAALVLYLAASVAVRGVHHHAPASGSAAAPGHGTLLTAADTTDDGHPCPICDALLLAQAFPVNDPLPMAAAPTGDIVPAGAVRATYSSPRSGLSRAPPAR